MRTVIYGAACSLDLFITGPAGAIDWIVWSDDVNAYMAEFWPRIDTIVMGRKTYEFAMKSGGGGGEMPCVTSYVFSRTLEAPGTTLVTEDAGEFVRKLKAQPGKDICVMGGGELAKSLFEADVIDEYGLNIHPVLLGLGVPLLPPINRRVSLELIAVKAMKGGCVLATYRVKR